MSEQDFKSYKQILSVDPKYDLNPKSELIIEMKIIKYCLIGIAIGGILSILWDPLGVIAGFSFVTLVMSLILGGAESISSHERYKSDKRKYFNEVRNAIIASKSYEEFKSRIIRI